MAGELERQSAVRLNDFFRGRNSAPEVLDRCPACRAAGPFAAFTVVKGTTGSEGEGVWMPASRCRRCGLVFLNPRLPAEAAAAFYRESERVLAYFTSGIKEKRDTGRGFAPFATRIERHLRPEQRDLFDFGCRAGAFLRLMRDRGFRVAGTEINPSAAEAARTRFGLEVITADADGAIDRLEREGRRFDVVTLIHTFEHLAEPLRVLERLRAIVRQDGLLAINVPNVRYFLVPLDRALGTQTAGIWDPVSHYSYFSLASLT